MSQDATPSSPTPAASAEGEVEVITPKGQRERHPGSSIRNHDFRQSGFLTPSELRRIRIRHEQFIRSLAARLAIFLRLEFVVTLNKLQIVGYQKFTEALPSQTHITLFRIDPLKGAGLLVMPPRLCLGLVDRLLGGPGQMPESGHDLSDIEVALNDQIATLILTEWCNHWPEMRDLHSSLLGHETNSHFLQTSPPDTAMLILSLNAGVGEKLEVVQMAFPYATVEPLMRHLCPPMPESETAPQTPVLPSWNNQFDDIKVTLKAEWHGLQISAAEIANLKEGEVLMLAPESAARVQLRCGKVPKFAGHPGTQGGKWAIQLTELIQEPSLS